MENLDRTCSICLHDRKQPKILTCSHVYCCQCLHDYVNKSLKDGQFPCPLCRLLIQLPSGGVEEFQDFSEGDDVCISDDVLDTNTETDDVYNMNEVAALEAYVGLCDMCESQTIVKHRCKDCKQNICVICRKGHRKIPSTKNHVVIDFVDGIFDTSNHGSPVDLCPVHTSKPIEIHCVECKTCVCLHCYVDENNRGVHNGHLVLNLDNKDTQTKLRDDLKYSNSKLRAQISRLQNFSDHLTSKLSEIDICCDEACNKVDQQVKLISKLVHFRAEQIKTQINKTRDEERKKLDILKKEMETSITELRSDIKDSRITLEGESLVKIVDRSERNRNDEMQVSQKDLVVPDLQIPDFLPGNDVRDDLEEIVGECKNFKQQNFTLKYNINTISSDVNKKQKKYFDFGKCKWSVDVSRKCKDGVETVGVFLSLSKIRDQEQRDHKKVGIKKVKVKYSLTILNKVDSESRTRSSIIYEFEVGSGYGYPAFIDLQELKNTENGFMDKDGNFSMRILIQEL